MKTKLVTAGFAISILAGVSLATPANAAPPDRGGCPRGFQIMTVEEINKNYTTPGFEGAVAGADENDDEKLCIKILPPAVDFFDPTFFYQDNDFPVPVK